MQVPAGGAGALQDCHDGRGRYLDPGGEWNACSQALGQALSSMRLYFAAILNPVQYWKGFLYSAGPD